MVQLDPRTKLIVLVLNGLFIFIVSNVGLFTLLGAMTIYLWIQGMFKKAILYVLIFVTMYRMQYLIYSYAPGEILWMGVVIYIVVRFIPVMMGVTALSVIPPGELIAGLQKLRIPKLMIISLAVGLRFMPNISREFKTIRNAMYLRGISFALIRWIKNPITTIEYAFVPLMMRTLKITDELNASAFTRGIDSPNDRTCLHNIQLQKLDNLVISLYFVMCIFIWLYFS